MKIDVARSRPWPLRVLIHMWLPIVLIGAWFAVSAGSTSIFWPPLTTTLTALVESFTVGEMWSNLAFSLSNYLVGLCIAVVVGIAGGLIIGRLSLLRSAVMPLLDFARSTPQVSFVPVIILALGIGALPKILLISVACLWPILLNTVDGVTRLPASFDDTVRSYAIPLRLRIFKVFIPGALPSVVVGIRIAISVGIVMLIVSEMFGASQGIGYFITQSGQSFNMPATWAGTILIGFIGYALSATFAAFEHKLLAWHYQIDSQPARSPSEPIVSNADQTQEQGQSL